MNDQAPPAATESSTKSYTKYYILGGVALLTVLGLYALYGGGPTTPSSTANKTAPDDPVQTARLDLNKSTDVNTCRVALTHINQHLGSRAPGDLAGLAADEEALLKRQFELTSDEWAELSSGTFTLLDGQYLETCFLLRDAIASFTRDGLLNDKQPTEQAAAAFAWAVRQVRLKDADTPPLPIGFVLRRGYGTALERALVFLALLQQLDMDGCLLALKEPFASSFPLWCCGVLVGKDIYLFDPRLGIALPGPKGQGIVTLAAVQSQPELLGQLAADGYDVSPELARKARVYLATSLSALAPRMRHLAKILQDPDVAAPAIPGRFGVDAAAQFRRFGEALARDKSADTVRAWPPAVRTLRSALPSEEGGVDKNRVWKLMEGSLVPIRQFPALINPDMGRVYTMMLQKFANPFLSLFLSTQQPHDLLLPISSGVIEIVIPGFESQPPRELLLRGHFNEASRILTARRKETNDQLARLKSNAELPAKAREALESILESQANLMRAQKAGSPNVADLQARLEEAWKQGQPWLNVLVEGHAAGPLSQEVNFQLALAKHEQAERLQLRLENAQQNGKVPADPEEVRRTWRNAAEWWATYLQEFGDSPAAPAARFHASRAQLMLGEREAAIELLRDVSGQLTDLEKVGRLYLVRHLEQKK